MIYASDIAGRALHGAWAAASDSTSPNGLKLATPDTGVANTSNALAAPADYVDVTFTADAGTPYTIWLRTQALANSKFNDSLWVQFSDAQAGGSPIYHGAYWLSQPATVTFTSSGTHTIRLQVREDGVQFDQMVLSPATYLNTPPGPATSDSTIVPR